MPFIKYPLTSSIYKGNIEHCTVTMPNPLNLIFNLVGSLLDVKQKDISGLDLESYLL